MELRREVKRPNRQKSLSRGLGSRHSSQERGSVAAFKVSDSCYYEMQTLTAPVLSAARNEREGCGLAHLAWTGCRLFCSPVNFPSSPGKQP